MHWQLLRCIGGITVIGAMCLALEWLTLARPFVFFPSPKKLDLRSDTIAVKRAIIEATDLPVYSINAPRILPGIDFSDHVSYWNAGFPAVMITDTAFYRNRHYHSPADTPERLDYKRLSKVVLGVYNFLVSSGPKT